MCHEHSGSDEFSDTCAGASPFSVDGLGLFELV